MGTRRTPLKTAEAENRKNPEEDDTKEDGERKESEGRQEEKEETGVQEGTREEGGRRKRPEEETGQGRHLEHQRSGSTIWQSGPVFESTMPLHAISCEEVGLRITQRFEV